MVNKRQYLIVGFAILAIATACAAPPAAAPAAPTAISVATSAPQPTQAPATTTLPPATATTASTATALPATATSAPTATKPAATSTTAPTATVPPAASTSAPTVAAPATTASTSGGSSGKVDMDKIMPPGKGRDLLVNNCTSCHSFVCAIKGQRPVSAWEGVKLGHRERVSSLGDDDYNTLFTYLAQNFNDTKPSPELPPALADLGCQAQ